MNEHFESRLGSLLRASASGAPAALRSAVIARIHAAALRSARIRFASGFFGVLASFAAILPVVSLIRNSVVSSGAAEYLSLIFSDADLIVQNLGAFALSLLEALPLALITALLSLVFMLALFARLAASGRFVIRSYAAA